MKLYTKTVCPKCLWVKSEIERNGIEVELVNIDNDEEARQSIIDAGLLSVPILEVDGKMIGDVNTIIEELGKHSQ